MWSPPPHHVRLPKGGDPVGQIAVFIDGAYLDRVCGAEIAGGRLDYEALIARICSGNDLYRVYYCDAPPHQSNPPSEEESRRTSY